MGGKGCTGTVAEPGRDAGTSEAEGALTPVGVEGMAVAMPGVPTTGAGLTAGARRHQTEPHDRRRRRRRREWRTLARRWLGRSCDPTAAQNKTLQKEDDQCNEAPTPTTRDPGKRWARLPGPWSQGGVRAALARRGGPRRGRRKRGDTSVRQNGAQELLDVRCASVLGMRMVFNGTRQTTHK